MKLGENEWKLIKDHLNYSDDEMNKFRNDPKNEEILLKRSALINKTIVVKVVESHGCNSHHHIGDKFYLDGAGNFISKLCPKRMCVFSMGSIAPLVFGMHELFYAGVDPNEMRFKRAGCHDVGVNCGGWGNIVVEASIIDRKDL